MSKQEALFSDRFLESFTGKSIMNDSKVAIIELIANAWDAGATKVSINWPISEGELFSIRDNGHGMTDLQFKSRFRTLAYDRVKELGEYALIPEDHKNLINKRPIFGRNGKGRLSGFAFGEIFNVISFTT
jgi:hypothetical protein